MRLDDTPSLFETRDFLVEVHKHNYMNQLLSPYIVKQYDEEEEFISEWKSKDEPTRIFVDKSKREEFNIDCTFYKKRVLLTLKNNKLIVFCK